jgi:hypothetical protein
MDVQDGIEIEIGQYNLRSECHFVNLSQIRPEQPVRRRSDFIQMSESERYYLNPSFQKIASMHPQFLHS